MITIAQLIGSIDMDSLEDAVKSFQRLLSIGNKRERDHALREIRSLKKVILKVAEGHKRTWLDNFGECWSRMEKNERRSMLFSQQLARSQSDYLETFRICWSRWEQELSDYNYGGDYWGLSAYYEMRAREESRASAFWLP
jgi:hypothetical protein